MTQVLFKHSKCLNRKHIFSFKSLSQNVVSVKTNKQEKKIQINKKQIPGYGKTRHRYFDLDITDILLPTVRKIIQLALSLIRIHKIQCENKSQWSFLFVCLFSSMCFWRTKGTRVRKNKTKQQQKTGSPTLPKVVGSWKRLFLKVWAVLEDFIFAYQS